ncbi:MAG: type II toxin-antitoxin system HicA family toxin [Chloroflexi bacterium]|nr:type II toxin-antitoxin system HicA family toxin [Chloroflexota bacterium]
MKRHELLKHLKLHGCQFLDEGKRHAIYFNPANRKTSTVPRHIEIPTRLALKICKDLGIPQP